MSAGEEGDCDTIRDTVLGQCIGSTILDITAADTDDFLAGGPDARKVYFHMSNGVTIYATIGVDGEDLLGSIDMDDEDEQTA